MTMVETINGNNSGKNREKVKNIAGFLMKNFVSHFMLFLLVAGYSVGGAFLFQNIEMQGVLDANVQNAKVSKDIDVKRVEIANQIWMFKWGQDYAGTVDKLLTDYQIQVSDAIKNNKYIGNAQESEDFSNGWAFPSALLFTISIVTTIGYGHVFPITSTGQVTVIFYAIIGVPLMLSFLANIGDAMARFFRLAYGRGCCYFCWKRRKANYELNRQRLRDIRAGHVGKSGNWKEQALVDEKGKPKFATGEENKVADDTDLPTSRRRHARSRSPSPDSDKKEHDSNKTEKDGDAKHHKEKDEPKEDDFDSYQIWEDIEDPDEEVINVPISLTLVIIAAYLFLGAVLFASWNSWSWITGAYFSFVTLSTIGFGDLVPGMSEVGTATGNVKMAVSYFYIIFGLAVISMSFNLMMEEMLAKFRWLGKKLGIIEDDKNKGHDKADDKEPLVKEQKDENATKKNESPSKNRPHSAVSKAPTEFKHESEEKANHEIDSAIGHHDGGRADSHV